MAPISWRPPLGVNLLASALQRWNFCVDLLVLPFDDDRSASKGCFAKRDNVYFGIRGTVAKMTETDLPGGQQRLTCEEHDSEGIMTATASATLTATTTTATVTDALTTDALTTDATEMTPIAHDITAGPTTRTTDGPSKLPTKQPSEGPTTRPTRPPQTDMPSKKPTSKPSNSPYKPPSKRPSKQPTMNPGARLSASASRRQSLGGGLAESTFLR